ncbi:LRR receptor-like serine/threonine-protein kinase EFR [Hevea brasiliensis]|uniref:LRR receptor-like serine/threonine-protein kinase EFR n=1 Tax=Hevea brasiliensis TaxID=3981 RepID=UPI0025F418AA|nr:LRR receptor-like serine/threonine-protein kinase EFR [Hevea brasiliensis]
MELSFKAPPIDAATAISGNETDHLALLKFKAKIVHDPQNATSSWNNSAHFCNWEGVICGRKHQRVTLLELNSKDWVGTLSPYMGNMSFLREISLYNNSLQGDIPSELGRLFRLRVLNLKNNSFEGKIPSNLHDWPWISVQQAGWKYPSEACRFVQDSKGQLKHLSIIALGSNNLSGIIPPAIYNISSITIFSMYDNSLHGSLPSNIGHLLPYLQRMQIWGNHFSGSIPVSLSNAFKLEYISLQQNNFTGNLDVDFGGLQSVGELYLFSNHLESSGDNYLDFIISLLNCSNLKFLDTSYNQFKGALPKCVANNISSPVEWSTIKLVDASLHGYQCLLAYRIWI